VTLDFDTLIAEQDAALARASGWLGSPEHLEFVIDVVHSIDGLDDVTVSWVPPGRAGYWEAKTRTIAAERPTSTVGVTPEYLVKMALIGVLHETLHARHSSPTPMFRQRLRNVSRSLERPVQILFNLLEDGRITALGKADDPGVAAALDQHLAAAVDQLRNARRADAETATPSDPRQQLFFALAVYAMTSQVPAPLHPGVHAESVRLQPTIDATRSGSTDDCGIASIELVEAMTKFQPSISR
jgi:hypothetical protein